MFGSVPIKVMANSTFVVPKIDAKNSSLYKWVSTTNSEVLIPEQIVEENNISSTSFTATYFAPTITNKFKMKFKRIANIR